VAACRSAQRAAPEGLMAQTTLDLVSIIRSSDFAKLRDELVRWRPQSWPELFAI